MIIQFGKLSYMHLIIIFLPIFREIPHYILEKRDKYNAFFLAFNDFLGLTCCGIIHLIVIKIGMRKINKKGKNKKQKKVELDLVKKDEDKISLGKKPVSVKQEILQSIQLSEK